jgi:hypothetical protein
VWGSLLEGESDVESSVLGEVDLDDLGLGKESLVILLSLDECFLEEVGIYSQLASYSLDTPRIRDLLSEFANRMARVCASGSPSLTSAAAFQTQLRSDPTLGDSFISGTTIQI